MVLGWKVNVSVRVNRNMAWIRTLWASSSYCFVQILLYGWLCNKVAYIVVDEVCDISAWWWWWWWWWWCLQCWSVRKMLKERQSCKGIQSDSKDSEPALVLPQLAKAETKAYSPSEFGLCHVLQNLDGGLLIHTLLIFNTASYGCLVATFCTFSPCDLDLLS